MDELPTGGRGMTTLGDRCITCGAPVTPLSLRYKRRLGGVLSLGNSCAVYLADPTRLPMLCDHHFPIWLAYARAQQTWAKEVAPNGLGLSAVGLRIVARAFGMSYRTLKKRLRRSWQVHDRNMRRAKGRHNWPEIAARQAFLRSNLWIFLAGAAAACGLGAFYAAIRTSAGGVSSPAPSA